MKIAILSDSHDNVPNMLSAMDQIQKSNVQVILFCGDFSAPFMIEVFNEFKGDVHVVFGNNDGDRFRMAMNAKKYSYVTLHGEYAALNLGGRRIGMTHYPFYAEAMAKSGDFDMVAFGHDHTARILNFDKALAINPGAIMQAKNGNPPSFAIYDTTAHAATLYALDGSFLTV
jgi:putative phosphoesterase